MNVEDDASGGKTEDGDMGTKKRGRRDKDEGQRGKDGGSAGVKGHSVGRRMDTTTR